MTKKELCSMCTEYSIDSKCDHTDSCKLQNILSENTLLKKENKELKKKIQEMECRRRWDMFPDMMGR